MRRFFVLITSLIIITFLIFPIHAMDFTAPDAPSDVQKYIPEDTTSFGEGLWYVVKASFSAIQPDVKDASRICLSIIAVALLLSLAGQFSKTTEQLMNLLTALSIGLLMFQSNNVFLQIGTDTIDQMSDYGKLLLPSLTAASAASGAATTSAALYTGTFLFVTVLTALISKCIVPMVYISMALSIASCAVPNDAFKGIKSFVKWLSTWSIKTVLYIFSGYMGITGVISGSVDAAAIKAAKLTISGAVPVVGSVISDASETILVSAGIMKNTVGIYGLLATVAICIGPFLRIGIHYLLLKLTSAVCGVFASKNADNILKEMTASMGLVLAMTGTVCLLILISIVCFIRSST